MAWGSVYPRIVTAMMLLMSLGPTEVHAQAVTVVDAARAALGAHPSMRAATAAVAGATATVRETQAARFPRVSANANVTQFEHPMVVAPLHSLDPSSPPTFDRPLIQGDLSISYGLFDAGARGARIERAEALRAGTSAGVDGVRMQLLADVVRAYLGVLTTREVLAAHERRIAALRAERDRAARLYAEGRAARVMVLRAEAALSEAGADAQQSAADVDLAVRELARLSGINGARVSEGAAPVVLGGVVNRDRGALLRAAMESNPRMQQLRSEAAAAEQLGAEARSLRLPRLDVGGRYIEYASSAGHREGEWQAGVQVSYPVFTGGARGAAEERAAAELTHAHANLDAAELEIAGAIDRALVAIETARGRSRALAATVEQAEEVARIEHLALEAGAGLQSDYLTAEADLFRARSALTEAVHAEIQARVELAAITGDLSLGWIETHLETRR